MTDGDKEEGPGTERFARSDFEGDGGNDGGRYEARPKRSERESESGKGEEGVEAAAEPLAGKPAVDLEASWARVRTKLRSLLGEEVFSSWFEFTEFERFDGTTVYLSTPTKFLKNWLQGHYGEQMLKCCAPEFAGAQKVQVGIRTMGTVQRTNQAVRTADTPAAGDTRLEGRRGGATPVAVAI